MSDSKTIQQWLKQQKPYAGSLIKASIALGTLAGLCLIAQAALLAWIADKAMFEGWGIAQLSPYLWAMLLFIVARALLTRWVEHLAFQGAVQIKTTLRQQLYEKLFKLDIEQLSTQRSGELSTMLYEGIESLEAYYTHYLPAVSFSALLPLSILVIVFPLDWQSGLIFLVTLPLIPFFMIMIGTQAERLNQERWQSMTRMSNHFLDVIQGLTTLKLFNASQRELQFIAQVADEQRKQTLSVLKVAFLSSLALEFLATISIALVAVTIGFRLYFGTLDFSLGFLVLLLAPEFYFPLRNLGTQYHARMEAISAAENIMHWLQQEEKPKPQKALDSTKPQPLTLKNISFSYQQTPTLIDISYSFAPRGLYAIVGQSGAGKSTLLDILLGFLTPKSGQIYYGEQNLTKVCTETWQQKLAWIPQKPHLFYGSLRQNLLLANSQASDEQLMQALSQAGLASFVTAQPQGLETFIGEQGIGLSGGQRQRLALARAFLKQSPILLLDEPSAHLDPETENIIQQAIYTYSQQHLVIVIAQRLHTIESAKQILVLQDGKLIEQGNHQQLLTENGHYAQLLRGEL